MDPHVFRRVSWILHLEMDDFDGKCIGRDASLMDPEKDLVN